MEKEIIPTENIVFAVLNDGTVVNKLTEKDAEAKAEDIMELFKGIEDITNNSNEEVFSMFALAFLLFDSRIKMAMMSRCEKEQSKKQ